MRGNQQTVLNIFCLFTFATPCTLSLGQVTNQAELLALGCSLDSCNGVTAHWEQEIPFKIVSVTVHLRGEIPDSVPSLLTSCRKRDTRSCIGKSDFVLSETYII